MSKLVYIETYGCQMNVADTELMLGILGKQGYAQTDDAASADLMLVNTCAVRDSAEQRIVGRMGELKRFKRPGDVLGVVGCMAQRLGPLLLERAPHVDLVIGPDGYRGLVALVEGAAGGDRSAETEFRSWEHYEDVVPVRGNQPGAFVTVQRGCDYKCTFCIVPYTRGPERSRKLEHVTEEAAGLAARGVSEITLLGQTVNSYNDGTHDFADLLRAVGAVDGIRRVRFTSPHPNDFSDRVIHAMSDVPELCEHVHLPVQSGSSRLLKRMLRRYTRGEYLDCLARLRDAIPGLAVTTDIIVGFPGETEDDFNETMSLVEEAEFDDAFTFRYSQRDGTPALKLKGRVDSAVSGRRLECLIEKVREISRAKNVKLVDSVQEVLVEKLARRGRMLQTRTRNNKVVLIDGDPGLIGSYLHVRLTGTTGATFSGVPLSSRARGLQVV